MATARRYPIGIQTFETVREENYVYIDKTDLIYKLVHQDGKYYFLSRPRRFGKSLLVSTLHSYFVGRKDLFKNLAIESLEKEWNEYPVLHFDLSGAKHMEKDRLLRHLSFLLSTQEENFGVAVHPEDVSDRMSNLIEKVYKKTGRQVVVLIDEYDAPLLDVVHEEENLNDLRQVMRDFYSPLKKSEPMLRFVFLTGITKFSQLSIFSEFNNIKNISMDEKYAALCGITKEELLTQMSQDIDSLATRMKKTREDVIDALAYNYDGYHFTWPSPDIFNPYSLLNCFSDGKISDYWFSSGTPTYLINMMRKFNVLPTALGSMDAQSQDFDAPTERMTSLTPLLYQSGYITIKGYDEMFDSYKLDIPNHEVELGLMRSLIPYYITPDTLTTNNTIVNMGRALYNNDIDAMMGLLKKYLATIPYTDNTNYEGHYQQVLYIIFTLMGAWADVEVHTANGRVDVVMIFQRHLYIFELKLDSSAEAAMQQIDLKNYPSRFSLSGYPVTKVAVNFDSSTRTVKDWIVE